MWEAISSEMEVQQRNRFLIGEDRGARVVLKLCPGRRARECGTQAATNTSFRQLAFSV